MIFHQIAPNYAFRLKRRQAKLRIPENDNHISYQPEADQPAGVVKIVNARSQSAAEKRRASSSARVLPQIFRVILSLNL
jgi:hypothetical protein